MSRDCACRASATAAVFLPDAATMPLIIDASRHFFAAAMRYVIFADAAAADAACHAAAAITR